MSLFDIDIEGFKKTEQWTELTKNKTLEEIAEIEKEMTKIKKRLLKLETPSFPDWKKIDINSATNPNLPLQE
jgi:NifU-like protein involved in Fe-S cluster formation